MMVNLIKWPLDSKLNEWGGVGVLLKMNSTSRERSAAHAPRSVKKNMSLWHHRCDTSKAMERTKIEMKMNILCNQYCIFVKDGDKTSN